MKTPVGTTEKNFCNLITKHCNSSMVSDILCGMGYETSVIGLTLNLPNKRIFGKASTLKLRKLRKGESPDGIYDALKSYGKIDDGDVIVVETGVPDRAYFGELNANLAIRAGAVGTIVCGRTRDIECVNALDYPVFSTGYSSADIKNYGTLAGINVKIKCFGVPVSPGDYVFADINGVVIIPAALVDKVVAEIEKTIDKEMSVKSNILKDRKAEDIPKITGNF
jgi:regulator of RNase E activity RraA